MLLVLSKSLSITRVVISFAIMGQGVLLSFSRDLIEPLNHPSKRKRKQPHYWIHLATLIGEKVHGKVHLDRNSHVTSIQNVSTECTARKDLAHPAKDFSLDFKLNVLNSEVGMKRCKTENGSLIQGCGVGVHGDQEHEQHQEGEGKDCTSMVYVQMGRI
jgi:hypothetical protein